MGFPHAIVSTESIRPTLESLVLEKDIGAVVIGESQDFSGADNPIAPAARALADWIGRRFGVPVYWEPEAFTTAQARRLPEKQEKSRAPTKHEHVDAAAAALILTSYLSRTTHG